MNANVEKKKIINYDFFFLILVVVNRETDKLLIDCVIIECIAGGKKFFNRENPCQLLQVVIDFCCICILMCLLTVSFLFFFFLLKLTFS